MYLSTFRPAPAVVWAFALGVMALALVEFIRGSDEFGDGPASAARALLAIAFAGRSLHHDPQEARLQP